MSRVGPVERSATLRLSSYDTTDHSYYSISNAGNAYGNTTSSYCAVNLTRGASAYTYIYFKFDTSSIPSDAEIVSVACTTRVSISNQTAANVASKGAKVCSGTTEKTASISVTTSVANRTFTMGTWTREELNDVRIKYYATRGTSNTNSNYNLRIYVGTLTVSYTVQGIFYEVTCSSSASGVTGLPLTQELEEGEDATVSIYGDLTDVTVTDNSTDVTSELVLSGDYYIYTISSLNADHVILISGGAPTQTLFIKRNGSWITIDALYIKQNGVWKSIETVFIKQNHGWRGTPTPIRLPEGYIEVEYIENQSNAYLNTGVSGNGITWTLTAQLVSASANEILIGRATSQANWFGNSHSSTEEVWYGTTIPSTTKATIVITFNSKAFSGTVNGVDTSETGTSASSATWRLFSYSGTYSFIGRIYGEVVGTKTTGEVFYGIPCINPDNVAGLYDVISDTFIGSVNSTEFIPGPPV